MIRLRLKMKILLSPWCVTLPCLTNPLPLRSPPEAFGGSGEVIHPHHLVIHMCNMYPSMYVWQVKYTNFLVTLTLLLGLLMLGFVLQSLYTLPAQNIFLLRFIPQRIWFIFHREEIKYYILSLSWLGNDLHDNEKNYDDNVYVNIFEIKLFRNIWHFFSKDNKLAFFSACSVQAALEESYHFRAY